MVVTGAVLVATGVGGLAGGALIGAGVNSIVGSYVSEATGGSSVAGWVGGMVTGGISGLGAGFAGNLLISATEMTGAICLGKATESLLVAYGSGALGSATGTIVSNLIDGKQPSKREIVSSALTGGVFNTVAGIGSGMGTAVGTMPGITETTQAFANALSTGWSLVTETVLDIFGAIPSVYN